LPSHSLPHGVELRPLVLHRDARGGVAELFRDEWGAIRPLQWTVVRSNAGVLRGFMLTRATTTTSP
jgi:dTDP-4-dehydrorhamnose 3,5-epimerase-like enzyme